MALGLLERTSYRADSAHAPLHDDRTSHRIVVLSPEQVCFASGTLGPIYP